MRLHLSHWAEVLGGDVPGVPPRSALCEAGAGHRRKHLAALSASQPIRGRARLRASPASIVWPGAGSGTVIEPERVERIGARSAP